jgi:hypothetical protein
VAKHLIHDVFHVPQERTAVGEAGRAARHPETVPQPIEQGHHGVRGPEAVDLDEEERTVSGEQPFHAVDDLRLRALHVDLHEIGRPDREALHDFVEGKSGDE